MKADFWVEEYTGKPPFITKRKRRFGKRKLEFIEWGSRPLMEFLEAIGKDTLIKHSQREVTEFITKYVNDKGLLRLVKKKKKFLCDDMLQALFGKKMVSRTKIYDLLEEHFAENNDDSDGDLIGSSEEENYVEKSSKSKSSVCEKKVLETPKSCFAAITPENIKLVYLKRTLVQELLKIPENCERKVVGSFIRMKSDPNDIYQRNRFQLQQVSGVELLSGAKNPGIETCLRVSNYFKDVSTCNLSDDNFSMEELEDLRERINTGLLKWPTVIELELKAQVLHEDITKHWIAKEISLLQKHIDHANEKGRRRELFGFLERMKILQNPTEQEKILLAVPEVAAEELPDETRAGSSEKGEGSNCEKEEVSNCTPGSISRGCLDISREDASEPGGLSTSFQDIFSSSIALGIKNRITENGVNPFEDPNVVDDVADLPLNTFSDTNVHRKVDGSGVNAAIPVDILNDCEPSVLVQLELPSPNKTSNSITSEQMLVLNSLENEPQPKIESSTENEPPQKIESSVTPTEVIELSDDEPADGNETCSEAFYDAVWHYLDPQEQPQGPFSLYTLKRWSDSNYFHPEFTVWKTGENPDERVLLVDVLQQQIFPED